MTTIRVEETETLDASAVVKRHSGGVGWPTVVLAVLLVAGDIGVAVLWARGVLPMVVGVLANSALAYAAYTVHHEATHRNISGRDPRWRWLESACGHMAGWMLLLEYRGYAKNHLRHHAHTNTATDPDLLVKGPLAQVPMKWALLMTLGVIGSLPFGDHIVPRIVERLAPPGTPLPSAKERAAFGRVRRLNQAALVVLVASIPLGIFWPVLLLWWLPSRIGILILMVLFQWLPHFPFERTDQFGATRVNRFPGSTWLLIQQDHHLIHHLYPTIPWYRYRRAFRDLRPHLEANGATIEGMGTTPHVPIQLRATPS